MFSYGWLEVDKHCEHSVKGINRFPTKFKAFLSYKLLLPFLILKNTLYYYQNDKVALVRAKSISFWITAAVTFLYVKKF